MRVRTASGELPATVSPDRDDREAHLRAQQRLGGFGDYLRRQDQYWTRVYARQGRAATGNPHLRGAEEADQQDRAAGYPVRAAFWSTVGPTPQLIRGDRAGAAAYLAKIEQALAQGHWTRNEWTRLTRLQRKWKARAEGRDPRFEAAGTRAGRLERSQEQQIRIERDRLRRNVEWQKAREGSTT